MTPKNITYYYKTKNDNDVITSHPNNQKQKINNNVIIPNENISVTSTAHSCASNAPKYEMVDHPKHYNRYSKEVIRMMVAIWGYETVIKFCELNAFKYRMRMGIKPENNIEQDLKKENWYLNMKEILIKEFHNDLMCEIKKHTPSKS